MWTLSQKFATYFAKKTGEGVGLLDQNIWGGSILTNKLLLYMISMLEVIFLHQQV